MTTNICFMYYFPNFILLLEKLANLLIHYAPIKKIFLLKIQNKNYNTALLDKARKQEAIK